MKITDEMMFEARERAEKALEYLDDNAKWELLRERIEQQQTRQMEAILSMLELEALWDQICPNVQPKDFSDVLAGRADLDKWLHRVRMAHALGMDRGKL